MKKITYKEMKKLEKIATEITGINPVEDREYQKINYETLPTKYGKLSIGKRTNIYKSKRRKL